MNQKMKSEIMDIANKACEDAALHKNSTFGKESINWGDLGCTYVEQEIVVTIEEASPTASGLREFIWKRLKEAEYDCEVITEW